jgi:N-formylglutamate amidohydrolase
MAKFSFDYNEPIICASIHSGHSIEPWLKKDMILDEENRLREEDPFTDFFTQICSNRIIADTSRFQVDLNRDRQNAVYQKPEDAWGLTIREQELSNAELEKVLRFYDIFYETTKIHIQRLIEKFGCVFVYDIHSYNHRRQGPDAPPDAQIDNPDIILGTSNMPEHWKSLVDAIQQEMLSMDFFGKQLDIRQNIKFSGGFFSQWLHQTFPDKICCIALEFKKIFMDEWTGLVDTPSQMRLREMLWQTFPLIKKYLSNH